MPKEGLDTPKKILLALPSGLLEEIDYIAQCEHRTRSDLMRESLRRYSLSFRRENAPKLAVVPEASPHE